MSTSTTPAGEPKIAEDSCIVCRVIRDRRLNTGKPETVPGPVNTPTAQNRGVKVLPHGH